MKKKVKFTTPQLESAVKFMETLQKQKNMDKEYFGLFYTFVLPRCLIIRYLSYKLDEDNGIISTYIIKCIKPNGEIDTCGDLLKDPKAKLQFESELTPIEIDAKGNLLFL